MGALKVFFLNNENTSVSSKFNSSAVLKLAGEVVAAGGLHTCNRPSKVVWHCWRYLGPDGDAISGSLAPTI